MELSWDMLSLGNADCHMVWIKDKSYNYVVIIDGGNPGDGEKAIKHYEAYIKPHVSNNIPILVINTHPHRDHIGGLVDIVHYFKGQIARFYYNDPLDYINEENKRFIKSSINQFIYESARFSRIDEALKDCEKLTDVLAQYGIPKLEAFSNTPLDHNLFTIIGPSKEFYKQQLGYFSKAENIKTFGPNTASEGDVNDVDEGLKPCKILDEQNDTSAENLTSVITLFKDARNRKFLFTADAGVDAFEDAQENGFDLSNLYTCQLPHHGSRRSINTNWVGRFNPSMFLISADGSKKHPRRAVISCIKKNLPYCETYSTHKGGTLNLKSNGSVFPSRNWSSATPL